VPVTIATRETETSVTLSDESARLLLTAAEQLAGAEHDRDLIFLIDEINVALGGSADQALLFGHEHQRAARRALAILRRRGMLPVDLEELYGKLVALGY
jgi:hypothetical protein